MQGFRDVLDECGFMDLGFMGPMFTWHKHFENYTVWERLDRAVATNDWFSMFPNTKVYHLDAITSDHKALLIHLKVWSVISKNLLGLSICGWPSKGVVQPLKWCGRRILRLLLAIGCCLQ